VMEAKKGDKLGKNALEKEPAAPAAEKDKKASAEKKKAKKKRSAFVAPLS
jgi:hypothetical protein